MENLECKACGCSYLAPIAGNVIYICPKCFGYVSSLSDYGFGPITPCSIFLGDKEIALIEEFERTKYKLISNSLNINVVLTKGYKNLEVYKEASDIIRKELIKEDLEEVKKSRLLEKFELN